MNKFPGIALIIDDQFKLAYKNKIKNPILQIQQNANKIIKNFLEENHIPFVSITNTNDVESVILSIESYCNIRLIFLDLDLNNDGFVNEEDDFILINTILKKAVETYGYFFLLINSAHSEKWTDIKKNLPDGIDIFKGNNTLVSVLDKVDEDILGKLVKLQDENYSLELIYDFEVALNHSRDLAFNGLIDFQKRSWNKIFKQLEFEVGEFASYSISEILLSNLKQHLFNIKYTVPRTDDPVDIDIIKKAFINSNYIDILNSKFKVQPIWTGNLYYFKQNQPLHGLNYALIINPECDIAQKKLINYLVVYGYEVNEITFPQNYDHNIYQDQEPPLHSYRQGKSNGKWKDLATLSNASNFKEHFYTLPFASQNNKTIVLDFREISSMSTNQLNLDLTLLKRIIDPMMTEVFVKISTFFNRKGLPKILNNKIKIFEV